MHYDIDLKTVKELTRYISPKEIERTRFERFNAPKINDGNLVCDKFFRQSEVFDSHTDISDFAYKSYDVDDLPIHYNGIREMDLVHHMTQQQGYTLETELPEYITLLRNGKKVFTEKFDYLSIGHPIRVRLDRALVQGHSMQNAVNILDAAHVEFGYKDELFNGGLKLIEEKYPLATVLKYIEMSKLKTINGIRTYIQGTFDFIKEFPHLRDLFIVKNQHGSEKLDIKGIKYFPELFNMCKTEKEAVEIAKACQHKSDSYLGKLTNEDHINLAKYIYTKNGNWTSEDADLIRLIQYTSEQPGNIIKELEEGKTVKQIIARIRKLKITE